MVLVVQQLGKHSIVSAVDQFTHRLLIRGDVGSVDASRVYRLHSFPVGCCTETIPGAGDVDQLCKSN